MNKYIDITNIFVILCCIRSVLSVFVDEFIEFAETAMRGSILVRNDNFNLCYYTFLLSLVHQNLVNFLSRFDTPRYLVSLSESTR